MRASGFSGHLRARALPGPGFSGCLRMWLGLSGFLRICPDFSGFRGVLEGRDGNGFVRVSPDFSGLEGHRRDAMATGFSGFLRACTDLAGYVEVSTDSSGFFRVFPGFFRVYGVL